MSTAAQTKSVSISARITPEDFEYLVEVFKDYNATGAKPRGASALIESLIDSHKAQIKQIATKKK